MAKFKTLDFSQQAAETIDNGNGTWTSTFQMKDFDDDIEVPIQFILPFPIVQITKFGARMQVEQLEPDEGA